jgi:hypothetical protein
MMEKPTSPENQSSAESANAWTRRNFIQSGGVVAAAAMIGLPQGVNAAGQAPGKDHLVLLDVDGLADGPVGEWKNAGSLGGGFAAPEGKGSPKVESVAGRKAVVYDGKSTLQSSFLLPAELAGGKPFTLMLWVFTPRTNHHAVMATLGARPQVCAEFNNNFGGPGSAAAFNGFGNAALGHRGGQPSNGVWHHIAYCFAGGEDGLFQLFLDGELSNEKKVTMRTMAGQPMFLGSGFDTNHKSLYHPFSGALGGLEVLSRPLSWREVRNAIGKYAAYAASPEAGATVEGDEVTLRWAIGREGAKPSLVIATSEGDLAAAKPQPAEKVRVDPATGQCEFGPIPLTIGQRVAWRVDQSTGAQKDTGDVWSFQRSTGPASSPSPRNAITNVTAKLSELKWQPGPHATAQQVFFGATAEEVAKATTPLAKLDGKAARIDFKQPLEDGKHYFWRVATANGTHPADAGEVWSFRTVDTPVKNDLTFIIATDQHYGRDNNVEINHVVVNQINSLAGTQYPDKFDAGVVRTPRGVIAPGDLLDKGYDPKTSQHKWDEWLADFGLDGTDGVLGFPVFEGIGNHDGPPVKSIPRAKIRERNKVRKGLTGVSENGLHYSWDWEHVHFVNTNLFPGDGPDDVMGVSKPDHDPEMSLDFLKKDLAKHVGDSGKPVIVITHYGVLGGMADWWTPEAKERFHQAIASYNVIGIFNGHSHGMDYIMWKDILTVHCGTTARPEYGHGDYVVIRVTETEMKIIHRKHDGWGNSRVVKIDTPAKFKA